jgi:fluoroquinolone resistance protein
MNKAIFEATQLEKANFLTAYNYSFRPEENKIKKAQFSKEGIIGLLRHYNIVVK